jgi:hypothetical protein
MKGLGFFTLTLLIAGVAAAAVIGLRSLPDIKRYLKIRQM